MVVCIWDEPDFYVAAGALKFFSRILFEKGVKNAISPCGEGPGCAIQNNLKGICGVREGIRNYPSPFLRTTEEANR